MPVKTLKDKPVEHIVSFKKGDYLFRQYDTTQDLFILRKGSIRIFKTEGGIDIDLDIIGPGNVVGEIASIDGGTRTATGVALEDGDALLIPAAEFQSILASIPEWFRKIALILVQRLREVDSRISRSIEGDRTNHVAALLSLLAFTDKCKAGTDGFEIDLKTAEYQIVDLLNMSLADVASSFDNLEALRYLRIEKSRIVLANREALDLLAEKVFQSTTELPAV